MLLVVLNKYMLSTLPDNPGDPGFWSESPGLLIRVWNLPDNRRSLAFLQWARLSDYKLILRWLSYFDVNQERIVLTHSPLSRPEPPVRIHVLSTACDVISFNGQGQLCPLTCAEWRDLSNHTRMSTIQSRTPEKKTRNYVTLTWKFPSQTH